ncbi:hypothetical protein HMPREF0083_01336 [Aneurinibacillus aneurinilyticus ATCC 12856]|uniref:Uncharacterized protein n=1 Tax=Aneurinibacillus aneurinilyticus ATCC 12856 TaxID=649747 RepID=U1YID4_ANEAE|nr:hypothetical protein HMPREF0083_01336 [Aneurinibacillus aneurinilyticus ATCC 12856]
MRDIILWDKKFELIHQVKCIGTDAAAYRLFVYKASKIKRTR